jgi:pimeloyl-ACP methyl ester carboxylesterase
VDSAKGKVRNRAVEGPRAERREADRREGMARVSRDLELCYRLDGDPRDPAVVLIAGLGQQLNEWPPELVVGLINERFRVVRFDNRDIGRSSRCPIAPPSALSILLQRGFRAEQYTLGEMALDTVGLLDRLGIDSAHLVGMSMGGMIGQTLAARYPSRVLTLTSLMSNTGARWVGRPRLSTYLRLYAPLKTDRDGFADQWVEMMRHIGSRGFPFDEARVHATALEAFDRGGGANADGLARQLAAIFKSGNRTAELRTIRVPTLVIHGERDPMLAASGGRATARAIPGARLLTIRGMGHDLPAGACPQIVRAIAEHARGAQSPMSIPRRAPEPAPLPADPP